MTLPNATLCWFLFLLALITVKKKKTMGLFLPKNSNTTNLPASLEFTNEYIFEFVVFQVDVQKRFLGKSVFRTLSLVARFSCVLPLVLVLDLKDIHELMSTFYCKLTCYIPCMCTFNAKNVCHCFSTLVMLMNHFDNTEKKTNGGMNDSIVIRAWSALL